MSGNPNITVSVSILIIPLSPYSIRIQKAFGPVSNSISYAISFSFFRFRPFVETNEAHNGIFEKK